MRKIIKRIITLIASVALILLSFPLIPTGIVKGVSLSNQLNLAKGKMFTAKSDIANSKSYSSMEDFDPIKLTDGKYGKISFGANEWVKFYRATGRTLTIDLEEVCTVNNIVARFLQNSSAGIVSPKKISVFVSQDGENFAKVEVESGNLSPFLPSDGVKDMLALYDIKFKSVSARYVAIHFDVTVNTFVDEIEIYGDVGSTLEPLTEYTDIISPPKGKYGDREALGGDYDIVCFHAGYSPQDEIKVNNTIDAFLPYVGYMDSKGKIVDTMFDSVMFLTLMGQCPSGGDLTISGKPTIMSDWEYLLDSYFSTEFNLSALNQATKQLKDVLSLDENHKTSVYLTIPYSKISDSDFGDFDGDGKINRIETYHDCLDVTEWFMDEVDSRWAAAGYEHLELKGYFCNSESITRQEYDYEYRFAADATKLMQGRGLYCVMIPYYQGGGIDKIDDLGFNAALMQPNLSFNEPLQKDPEGMMEDFAETAKQFGLGIQMEIHTGFRWEPEKYGPFYTQYLASASANGLMTGTIHAYYNCAGPGVFYDSAKSNDKDIRWAYDATYKFIKGTLNLPKGGEIKEPTNSLTAQGRERVKGDTGAKGDWNYTFKLLERPKNGSVWFNADNTFTYMADGEFAGEDTFIYDVLIDGKSIGNGEVGVTVLADKTLPDESEKDESNDDDSSKSDNKEQNKSKMLYYIIGIFGAIVICAGVAVFVVQKKKK